LDDGLLPTTKWAAGFAGQHSTPNAGSPAGKSVYTDTVQKLNTFTKQRIAFFLFNASIL
jgi:hypothetical protein